MTGEGDDPGDDPGDGHCGKPGPDREYLGRHPSLEAFALEVVAPLLRPEGQWLLACLDLARVLRALEGEDRLRLEGGCVYLERSDILPGRAGR